MNKEQVIKQVENVRHQVEVMLKDYRNVFDDIFSDDDIQALDIVIESLDNEWIDVRKQLPKFDEEVLVEMKDGSHCVATYHTETFNNKIILYWIYNDFTKYYCDNEKKEKNEVVAWKKFKPYEREVTNGSKD